MDRGLGALLGVVFGLFAALMVMISFGSWVRDSLREEVCSYACERQTGHWPGRVEWRGRGDKGHPSCACWPVETITRDRP